MAASRVYVSDKNRRQAESLKRKWKEDLKWAEKRRRQYKSKSRNKKISDAQRLYWSNVNWVRKETHRRRSDEYRSKLSKGVKKSYVLGKGVAIRQSKLSSKEGRKRNSDAQKKKWKDRDWANAILKKRKKLAPVYAEATRRQWRDPEIRRKRTEAIRLSMKKAKKTFCRNHPDGKIPSLSKSQKKRWSSLSARKKQSKALRIAWEHPIKGKSLRDGLYKSRPRWRSYMTKPESEVYKILKRLGYSYKWTGGGQGRIRSFVPDFMHTRQKRVIEVYGSYWHREENKDRDAKRIKSIKNDGYKVLIIRDSELKNEDNVVKKIKRFHSGAM